jgi:hypothetical protein
MFDAVGALLLELVPQIRLRLCMTMRTTRMFLCQVCCLLPFINISMFLIYAQLKGLVGLLNTWKNWIADIQIDKKDYLIIWNLCCTHFEFSVSLGAEARFLTREENEWYREPLTSNATFSKEDLPSEAAPVVDWPSEVVYRLAVLWLQYTGLHLVWSMSQNGKRTCRTIICW